jgi:hypothetical protein
MAGGWESRSQELQELQELQESGVTAGAGLHLLATTADDLPIIVPQTGHARPR